uniref:Uncharacterized protein n=1 Tax=Arundo donax TaxID=35708 RepID=A0A0A9C163_ARUDO
MNAFTSEQEYETTTSLNKRKKHGCDAGVIMFLDLHWDLGSLLQEGQQDQCGCGPTDPILF